MKIGDKVILMKHNHWTLKAGLKLKKTYTVRTVYGSIISLFEDTNQFIYSKLLFTETNKKQKELAW